MSTSKPRYRFTGRHGDTYYWERLLPGQPGLSEVISCNVAVFWAAR